MNGTGIHRINRTEHLAGTPRDFTQLSGGRTSQAAGTARAHTLKWQPACYSEKEQGPRCGWIVVKKVYL